MKTQYESACDGVATAEMMHVAEIENVPVEKVIEEIAAGRAVLPFNPAHKGLIPTIAGRAFTTKINANLGYSEQQSSQDAEMEKLDLALSLGADFVMDLSVGKGLGDIRRKFIERSSVPVGTVPIYEALSRVDGEMKQLTADLLMDVIRDQGEQGVDFMTLHAGLLREHVPLALDRKFGIASRGGAILANWMTEFQSENPLYKRWNEILELCKEFDITVSLGDGLRPGCLADASDAAQFAELEVLGELVQSCRKAGVQVMVEGPGHIPFDQVQMNMEREAEVCDDAPFYVLGPLVTDIAPGYDHITSAIGATMAAYSGACLLCYVTPAEHLGLPVLEDVRQGVIAYKIAAHSADVARGLSGARKRDDDMADARRKFDWERQFELALDPEVARERWMAGRDPSEVDTDHCSMCGQDFCAVRNTKLAGERLCNSTT